MPDTLTHYTSSTSHQSSAPSGSPIWGIRIANGRRSSSSIAPAVSATSSMPTATTACSTRPMRCATTTRRRPSPTCAYHKNFKSNESEDVIAADFGANLGKELNVGASFDYTYASGFYTQGRSRMLATASSPPIVVTATSSSATSPTTTTSRRRMVGSPMPTTSTIPSATRIAVPRSVRATYPYSSVPVS